MILILLYDEQSPNISSRTGQTCWKITGEPDSSYKIVASKTSQTILFHWWSAIILISLNKTKEIRRIIRYRYNKRSREMQA